MQKDIIDLNYLKEFKKATIYFLDSVYTVDIKLISDVYFETATERRSNDIKVLDGFLELDPKAFDIRGMLIDDYMPDEYRITDNLLSRLEKGADIYKIEFISKDKKLILYIPCNPLIDCHNMVVEYSDCASVERTESGNLRIYMGQSSKNLERKVIIYSEVCKNWDRVMDKNYKPDLLHGELINLRVYEEAICIEFQIFNPKSPCTFVVFGFEDYIIHSFDVYLKQVLVDDIEIEKMSNGHIYVRLSNSKICLECANMEIYISA